MGSSKDLDFASKLFSKINKLLEVSLDSHKDDKIFEVKYEELHMFFMRKKLEEILETNNEPELSSDVKSNLELEEIFENGNDFIKYFSDNSEAEAKIEELNNSMKKALKLLELKAQKGTLINL
ncbi:21972_t:CDS:2, partial [Dentiscutata erythropus]